MSKVAKVVAPRMMQVIEEEVGPIGPKELLIQVKAAGICHSDVAAYDGSMPPLEDPSGTDPLGKKLTFPYPIGHEPAGVVQEIGSEVTQFQIGDRVSGAGWTGRNQSFATHAILHEDYTVRVPPNVPWECALAEPLGAAVNIVRSTGVRFGDRIAVIGCGFMGLLVISLLARYPLQDLIAVDLLSNRLEIAKKFGANTVIRGDVSSDIVRAYQSGLSKGVDIAIDLTGRLAGLKIALQMVRKGRGTILMSSTYLKKEHFDLGEEIMMKAPQLLAVHPDYSSDFKADMQKAMWALESGSWKIHTLITHRFTLEECGLGHELAYTNNPAYIKGVIIP